MAVQKLNTELDNLHEADGTLEPSNSSAVPK